MIYDSTHSFILCLINYILINSISSMTSTEPITLMPSPPSLPQSLSPGSTGSLSSPSSSLSVSNNSNIVPRSVAVALTSSDSITNSNDPIKVPSSNQKSSSLSSSSSSSSSSSTSSSQFHRSSKRSSSTSNDFLYERDRFRARIQILNQNKEPLLDNQSSNCEICDDIGSKTTKLNLKTENVSSIKVLISESHDEIDEDLSPLDNSSKFYSELTSTEQPSSIPIKLIKSNHIEPIFNYYFHKQLPPTSKMFPWLHGLHEDNFTQKLFFIYQFRQLDNSLDSFDQFVDNKPHDIRFLMCVIPSISSTFPTNFPILKNSIHMDEILSPIDICKDEVISFIQNIVNTIFPIANNETLINLIINDSFKLNFLPKFLNLDPDKGVSLRNFHIQVAKLALCSDFIVYSHENDADLRESLARLLFIAQRYHDKSNFYNVFILDDSTNLKDNCLIIKPENTASPTLETHKRTQLNLLSNDLNSNSLFIWDNNYQFKEKIETTKMSSATNINNNVWVGNLWDHQIMLYYYTEGKTVSDLCECSFKNCYCDPNNSITFHDDESGKVACKNDISSLLPTPKDHWNLFVHCHKDAQFPTLSELSTILSSIKEYGASSSTQLKCHYVNFPSSGSIGLGDCKKENLMSIVNTCKVLYLFNCKSSLIYCSDGYTELSLLVLCFIMYSDKISVEKAMLKLHREIGRPFYIFNSDVVILKKLQVILNRLSPKNFELTNEWRSNLENLTNLEINELLLSPNSSVLKKPISKNLRLGYIANDSDDSDSDSSDYDSDSSGFSTDFSKVEDSLELEKYQPQYLTGDWVDDVEGSLPSRILPYLYLGSLRHANSLPLLSKLGITKIISVGEDLDWLNGHKFQQNNDIIMDEIDNGNIKIFNISGNDSKIVTLKNGEQHHIGESPVATVLKINNLQDDGISELTNSLPTILQFIDDEYKRSNGTTKILVHCRVGVSRSATVCIAEVMKRLHLSLPKAYLYVRVRRLNIVIQPNLRFMYELFKWREQEQMKQHGGKSLREIDWFVMCREITRLNIPYLNN